MNKTEFPRGLHVNIKQQFQ